MKPKILFYFPAITICLIFNSVMASTPVPLHQGMVITSSIQIKRASYQINYNTASKKPVITITGNNITVDFNEAVLSGSNDKKFPNEFYGVAILIKGDNITIRNARISGYKIALMATGCKNLKIEWCDFSYNYRQQLQSTWQSEDVSDWMSYHHNEKDEWQRYGAGIYLNDCNNAVIQHNTITGGQCALMLVRCDDGMIADNNFSFNSGIGIGLYRSSHNKIFHNQLDFNVRGYSFGIYNRGQDSAGILVFEQCNDNMIAFNSVTHSGDGFFLWAGQSTMDNGEGGCNDNYLYKNDFSYAPTNGVEVTFSSNTIRENVIRECDNGIWGGYSWQTNISGNLFYKNKTGIAIEHGQHISIRNNRFEQNKQDGIKIWARKQQPPDWVYAQKKDTRSQAYDIWGNSFKNETHAINLTLTDGISILKNNFTGNKFNIIKDNTVSNLDTTTDFVNDSASALPAAISGWQEKNITALETPSGKEAIRITEWGPYNFQYPMLFLKKMDSNGVYYFDVLGPAGNWKIKNLNNVTGITATSGIFPATLTAQKKGEDVQIAMEYTGPAFIDQFGKTQNPATKPVTFSFRDYKPLINWNVNWYSWDIDHNPNKDYLKFKDFIAASKPVKTESTHQLNYTWWGSIGKKLPADSFATVANAVINVKEGKYQLGVTADDLVKVFVDGKLVIDFWDAAKYVNDEDAHHSVILSLNGVHTIHIEHVENSGYATLIFSLHPL